ncbi:nuclear transport factor 2 family protein [Chengkuizengella marina]|uniref:SnoaL-like domain-containing protein n=1 Tax=Chengkuizengella marina TaxID=2507566 RepID=A0A6N9Q7X5_9BACL|nr:nuclear transport factor 2 family protein [Chengkuizengella marina]NBI30763.1 hypothetical protein [Chengkuizengella marina]
MNKFGVQYLDKKMRMHLREKDILHDSTEQHQETREILRQFQDGYTERDIDNVDSFVEKLFFTGEDICVLGTGTGELFLGSEQVKTLVKDDWENWGNVNIDCENASISVEDEVAWFATTGSVKFTFEDTLERYDRYLNFIQKKVEETGITSRQKISFINWVLSLTYHQRMEKKREYLWPLRLTGVLIKDANKWKIVHLQFSIPKGNFPDERFENSKKHLESYNKQNAMLDKYRNNQMTKELVTLLKSLETKLIGNKDISKEEVNKFFAEGSHPYMIGPNDQWCNGIEELRKYFVQNSDLNLTLDLEHSIASKSGKIIWVTVTGILKKNLTDNELAERTLEELENLFQADLSSKEKIFAAHRSSAYMLKESATGVDYTCPLRLTAVILNRSEGPVFHNIHFSFPHYWLLEGKVDNVFDYEKEFK